MNDAISREAVNRLIDELARAISDEKRNLQRGRKPGKIMADILSLPTVEPEERGSLMGYVKDWTGSCDLPENIQRFVCGHNANVQVNINATDCINGYGTRITVYVVVSMYAEKCTRCDYHSLFNYDPKNDCHKKRYGSRHNYERKYEDVFTWLSDAGVSLEKAFDLYLEKNSNENYDITPLHFSKGCKLVDVIKRKEEAR